MTKRDKRPVRLGAQIGAILSVSALLIAAGCFPAQAAPQAFDVPEQDLEHALRELARQAGLELLFEPRLTAGRTARALQGRYEPLEAFDRMLSGHGLEVRPVGANAVVVRRARRVRPARGPAVPIAPSAIAEEIVVTARPPGEPVRRTQTGFAVTVVGESRLERIAPRGVADVIALTPGFWVESSGGEASNNVRARGVPLDGYASVALLEDGLPVQQDAGLAFLNPDQLFRLHEGIERVEILRGGPAAVIAPYAVGGAINVVNRPAPDAPAAHLRTQATDSGGLRHDLWAGGPIGRVKAAASVFWREDDGVRDTGFRAHRGGMARVEVSGRLAQGGWRVAVAALDDQVPFYLPVPLRLDQNGDIADLPGFDARRGTLIGPDLRALDVNAVLGAGDPPFRIEDGTRVRSHQATIALEHGLDGAWRVTGSARVRASETERNGLFPRSPSSAARRLQADLAAAQSVFPDAAMTALRYAGDGAPFGGQGGESLVIEAAASSIRSPLDELQGQLRLDGRFRQENGSSQSFGVGVYVAQSETRFERVASSLLLDVRNNARRLDSIALDDDGREIGRLTDGGVTRYGVQYDDVTGRQDSVAVFVTGEATFPSGWALDAGLRVERGELTGDREIAVPRDLGRPETLADDLALRGTGVRERFARDVAAWHGTIGVRRTLPGGLTTFARATRSVRPPSLSAFYSDARGASAIEAPTEGYDLGVNLERRRFALYATAFRTRFDGFPFSETIVDAASGALVGRTAFASSDTFGLELEGEIRPFRALAIEANVTAQSPQFDRFAFGAVVDGAATTLDFGGRQLVRVPRVMATIAPRFSFANGQAEAGFAVRYLGERFADAANSVRLPPYAVIDAHAGVDLTERARLSLNIDNVTDTLGLTEGNPRAGQIASEDAGAALFTARPIFGRNWRVALSVQF